MQFLAQSMPDRCATGSRNPRAETLAGQIPPRHCSRTALPVQIPDKIAVVVIPSKARDLQPLLQLLSSRAKRGISVLRGDGENLDSSSPSLFGMTRWALSACAPGLLPDPARVTN